MMMGDGVLPSNTERGYVVRRLLRRAIRHLDVIGAPADSLPALADLVISYYENAYPALPAAQASIHDGLTAEETKFRRTLAAGIREFEKLKEANISGADAFRLFASFGFPLEMTLDLAREAGLTVDTAGFEAAMTTHRAASRGSTDKKFRGGLSDHSDMSIKYHTATHLLHKALQDVLGEHAVQKGSNITPERLRFDFSHPEKMTPEQLKNVVDSVNEKIQADLPVTQEEMSVEQARKQGALGLFGEKYGDRVRVYKIGDYSIEICGGPHVEHTGVLGTFSITKEESAGAGVRRIKGVLQ
jgi:alanyl-tRNA synthetase